MHRNIFVVNKSAIFFVEKIVILSVDESATNTVVVVVVGFKADCLTRDLAYGWSALRGCLSKGS